MMPAFKGTQSQRLYAVTLSGWGRKTKLQDEPK